MTTTPAPAGDPDASVVQASMAAGPVEPPVEARSPFWVPADQADEATRAVLAKVAGTVPVDPSAGRKANCGACAAALAARFHGLDNAQAEPVVAQQVAVRLAREAGARWSQAILVTDVDLLEEIFGASSRSHQPTREALERAVLTAGEGTVAIVKGHAVSEDTRPHFFVATVRGGRVVWLDGRGGRLVALTPSALRLYKDFTLLITGRPDPKDPKFRELVSLPDASPSDGVGLGAGVTAGPLPADGREEDWYPADAGGGVGLGDGRTGAQGAFAEADPAGRKLLTELTATGPLVPEQTSTTPFAVAAALAARATAIAKDRRIGTVARAQMPVRDVGAAFETLASAFGTTVTKRVPPEVLLKLDPTRPSSMFVLAHLEDQQPALFVVIAWNGRVHWLDPDPAGPKLVDGQPIITRSRQLDVVFAVEPDPTNPVFTSLVVPGDRRSLRPLEAWPRAVRPSKGRPGRPRGSGKKAPQSDATPPKAVSIARDPGPVRIATTSAATDWPTYNKERVAGTFANLLARLRSHADRMASMPADQRAVYLRDFNPWTYAVSLASAPQTGFESPRAALGRIRLLRNTYNWDRGKLVRASTRVRRSGEPSDDLDALVRELGEHIRVLDELHGEIERRFGGGADLTEPVVPALDWATYNQEQVIRTLREVYTRLLKLADIADGMSQRKRRAVLGAANPRTRAAKLEPSAEQGFVNPIVARERLTDLIRGLDKAIEKAIRMIPSADVPTPAVAVAELASYRAMLMDLHDEIGRRFKGAGRTAGVSEIPPEIREQVAENLLRTERELHAVRFPAGSDYGLERASQRHRTDTLRRWATNGFHSRRQGREAISRMIQSATAELKRLEDVRDPKRAEWRSALQSLIQGLTDTRDLLHVSDEDVPARGSRVTGEQLERIRRALEAVAAHLRDRVRADQLPRPLAHGHELRVRGLERITERPPDDANVLWHQLGTLARLMAQSAELARTKYGEGEYGRLLLELSASLTRTRREVLGPADALGAELFGHRTGHDQPELPPASGRDQPELPTASGRDQPATDGGLEPGVVGNLPDTDPVGTGWRADDPDIAEARSWLQATAAEWLAAQRALFGARGRYSPELVEREALTRFVALLAHSSLAEAYVKAGFPPTVEGEIIRLLAREGALRLSDQLLEPGSERHDELSKYLRETEAQRNMLSKVLSASESQSLDPRLEEALKERERRHPSAVHVYDSFLHPGTYLEPHKVRQVVKWAMAEIERIKRYTGTELSTPDRPLRIVLNSQLVTLVDSDALVLPRKHVIHVGADHTLGPYLRSLIAHELHHLVTASSGIPDHPEGEAALEALSMLAEAIDTPGVHSQAREDALVWAGIPGYVEEGAVPRERWQLGDVLRPGDIGDDGEYVPGTSHHSQYVYSQANLFARTLLPVRDRYPRQYTELVYAVSRMPHGFIQGTDDLAWALRWAAVQHWGARSGIYRLVDRLLTGAGWRPRGNCAACVTAYLLGGKDNGVIPRDVPLWPAAMADGRQMVGPSGEPVGDEQVLAELLDGKVIDRLDDNELQDRLRALASASNDQVQAVVKGYRGSGPAHFFIVQVSPPTSERPPGWLRWLWELGSKDAAQPDVVFLDVTPGARAERLSPSQVRKRFTEFSLIVPKDGASKLKPRLGEVLVNGLAHVPDHLLEGVTADPQGLRNLGADLAIRSYQHAVPPPLKHLVGLGNGTNIGVGGAVATVAPAERLSPRVRELLAGGPLAPQGRVTTPHARAAALVARWFGMDNAVAVLRAARPSPADAVRELADAFHTVVQGGLSRDVVVNKALGSRPPSDASPLIVQARGPLAVSVFVALPSGEGRDWLDVTTPTPRAVSQGEVLDPERFDEWDLVVTSRPSRITRDAARDRARPGVNAAFDRLVADPEAPSALVRGVLPTTVDDLDPVRIAVPSDGRDWPTYSQERVAGTLRNLGRRLEWLAKRLDGRPAEERSVIRRVINPRLRAFHQARMATEGFADPAIARERLGRLLTGLDTAIAKLDGIRSDATVDAAMVDVLAEELTDYRTVLADLREEIRQRFGERALARSGGTGDIPDGGGDAAAGGALGADLIGGRVDEADASVPSAA